MAVRSKQLDPYQLQRFIDAQAPVWQQARGELAAGEKRSHWMWFVFPQIRGLGSSFMAQRFAISGLDEAAAYLRHPLLGARLRECTSLVNAVEERSIGEIFGYPDDLKFHSSMTLFAQAVGKAGLQEEEPYMQALQRYFNGVLDPATLTQLQG